MSRTDTSTDFQISVPDKPGELLGIIKGVQDAGINLRALWAFGIGGGRAEVIVLPEDADAFREHARRAGLEVRERTVVHFTGPDELGALVGSLEQIASADINIHAFDAIAVGGKYGAYCWVDEGDVTALEKTVGAQR